MQRALQGYSYLQRLVQKVFDSLGGRHNVAITDAAALIENPATLLLSNALFAFALFAFALFAFALFAFTVFATSHSLRTATVATVFAVRTRPTPGAGGLYINQTDSSNCDT